MNYQNRRRVGRAIDKTLSFFLGSLGVLGLGALIYAITWMTWPWSLAIWFALLIRFLWAYFLQQEDDGWN